MDLIINTDKVREAKSTYDGCISDLEGKLRELKTTLADLRDNGFEGEAKKAFFDYLYADWETGFKQHIQDIEFLRDLLAKVADEAETVEAQNRGLTRVL